jgi:3-hydroxybutyryl-CoA dehydrogenase
MMTKQESNYLVHHSIKKGNSMRLQSVGIIGAGTMGNGIAQVCAVAGMDVLIIDVSDAALERGLSQIGKSLDRLVKKEILTLEGKHAALKHIKSSTSYADLKDLPLVIEAATENQSVKEKILQQVDAIVSKETIIATNTSSLSITKLAALDSNPSRFIGMHFFNPPPMMALVEVIRGLQTSDATHAAIIDMAKRIGKEPITVKNSPGFVVNRILLPMINEAFFVLYEGLACPEDIDAGMKLGCNQPIGPLALADLIGLDTCLAIMEVYFENFSDSKYRPCPLLREMVEAGYLGRKTGRGVFTYD